MQVDKKLKESAYDKMEDLKETTKSRLHAIIYKRANRYQIYMQSPVFVLPIRGTFAGHHSPIWVIRTGDVQIASADEDQKTKGMHEESGPAKNVVKGGHLDPNTSSELQTPQRIVSREKFDLAKVVRMLMRGKN